MEAFVDFSCLLFTVSTVGHAWPMPGGGGGSIGLRCSFFFSGVGGGLSGAAQGWAGPLVARIQDQDNQAQPLDQGTVEGTAVALEGKLRPGPCERASLPEAGGFGLGWGQRPVDFFRATPKHQTPPQAKPQYTRILTHVRTCSHKAPPHNCLATFVAG